MENDPDWWRSPVTPEEWAQEQAEAEERRKQKDEERLARYARNAEVWGARMAEFKDNPKLRMWTMWRQYRAGGTTFREIGDDFGVTQERVRQVVKRCDRLLRTGLQRAILTIPVLQEIRDATLGIEFVFRNELVLEDKTGWEQLEPTALGSAYDPMIPEWREEWGRQDTSPPKPIPAYTFYKVIIPKEQTDGE